MFHPKFKHSLIFKSFSAVQVLILVLFFTFPPKISQAQSFNVFNLPKPGTMVDTSEKFTPVLLRGISLHPENPLVFDFIVDPGNSKLQGNEIKDEAQKLIKYFLASLTVPEKDLWVNLSPYEENRIIPEGFGQTEMGRDLLAQDYILKQLSASLIYPENDLGKSFWSRVYQKAKEAYGTTDIPVNTFNKVWIMPDKAVIVETDKTAYIARSRLKVMLEEDYVALNKNRASEVLGTRYMQEKEVNNVNSVSSLIIREIILPEIEKEVNEGKNFAQLRQIYNSLVLAAWFKMNLKNNLINEIYSDQNKIPGVDVDDKASKDKIYQRYLEAYREGVFNYIKEDFDQLSQEVVPRKYFSGGFRGDITATNLDRHRVASERETQGLVTSGVVAEAEMRSAEPEYPQQVVTTALDRNVGAARKFVDDGGSSASLAMLAGVTEDGLKDAILQIQAANPQIDDSDDGAELVRNFQDAVRAHVTDPAVRDFLVQNAKHIDGKLDGAANRWTVLDTQSFLGDLIRNRQQREAGTAAAMLSGKTLMEKPMLEGLVSAGGAAVRKFLGELAAFEGNRADSPYKDIATVEAIWQAAKDYQAHPENYTDERLTSAPASAVPRIEIRGTGQEGEAAQVAIIGIPGNYRQGPLDAMRGVQGSDSLSIRMGGFMTLEANVRGVNKALSLDYLKRNFSRVLDAINYTPGESIDARATRTIVTADGDGTTYGKPSEKGNPLMADSPAREALLDYLRSGGVYMIISGNDLNLTRDRLVANEGIPSELRNRVIIAANGGANLARLTPEGNLVEIQDYTTRSMQEFTPEQVQGLDLIYLGDDEKKDGNDFPAFEKVGFDRAVNLASKIDKVPAELRSTYVGGLETGTRDVLRAVVESARANPQRPIFNPGNIFNILARARTISAREFEPALVEETKARALQGLAQSGQFRLHQHIQTAADLKVSGTVQDSKVYLPATVRSAFEQPDRINKIIHSITGEELSPQQVIDIMLEDRSETTRLFEFQYPDGSKTNMLLVVPENAAQNRAFQVPELIQEGKLTATASPDVIKDGRLGASPWGAATSYEFLNDDDAVRQKLQENAPTTIVDSQGKIIPGQAGFGPAHLIRYADNSRLLISTRDSAAMLSGRSGDLQEKLNVRGVDATGDETVGGIDFNPENLRMEVNKENGGINVQFDPKLLEEIRLNGIEGFVPIILNVHPINSVVPLLGASESSKVIQVSGI